jgi:type VI secretion system (T6SS) baseplate-like injector VgrG
MKSGPKFYGIYSATVLNNIDPALQGRITVMVPDVGSVTPSTFVNPCLPMAGKQQGIFMVPQIGSTVWIQFEAGDPDKPIWMGGSWPDPAMVPTAALMPVEPPGQSIVFQTSMQQLFMISDAPPLPMLAPIPAPAPPGTGGIVLRSPSGAMIVVNDAGIFINNGKGATVELVANSVMINKVALVVI